MQKIYGTKNATLTGRVGRAIRFRSRSAALTLTLGFACTATLFLTWTTSAHAQVSTAAIHGTVLDPTGAAVPGAQIVATQSETNFTSTAVSGSNGTYDLNTLPVGSYVVKISKPGFAGYEETGLVLEVGQTATVVASLRVGVATEQVQVSTATPAVETTTAVLQTVVNEKTIQDLPLNGRNPATLVFTAPGVTDATLNLGALQTNSTVRTVPANLPSQIAPVTNGVAPGGTYFSLDGAGNTDPYNVIGGPFPNPDATQEFGVVTGTYGARYVSAPGGAVNVITRSGSNQIHGSVFEFIRNGAVNALQYYAGGAPDTLKRNQYGFAVGGPIIRDKLFAFASLQETATRSQTQVNNFVGTTAMRSGQFVSTKTGKTVTITPNIVATNLLKYIPLATDGAGNYIGQAPLKINEPQGTVRLDYTLGSHRLFARYFTDQYAQAADPMVNNNVLLAQPGSTQSWSNFALGDTWTSKGASWVIDGRASYIHVKSTNSVDPSLAPLSAPNLGEQMTGSTAPKLGLFYAGGFFLSVGSNSRYPRDSYDYNVDVLHVKGRHQIAFGSNLRFVSLHEYADAGQEPSYVFFGTYSNAFYGPLNYNSYADFIAGRPILFAQADGLTSDITGKLFGFYAEDKYSASERLTVTGGVRYDPYRPFSETANQIDCFSPGKQSTVFTDAPLGLLYPGDPGCNSSGTTGKYGLIQPRIGVAYKVNEKGTTAIRAGFGIYSAQAQLQSFSGFSAPPFVRNFQVTSFSNNDINPYAANGIANPFASGFQTSSYVPPSNVAFPTATGYNASAVDPNYRPAYTKQYTLSIQHAFTPADSLEVAYVGTNGTHVSQTYDDNAPVYIAGTSTGAAGSCGTLSGSNLPAAGQPCSSTTNERQRRPYAATGLLQVKTIRSNATANYNGMNVSFRHEQKGGINFYAGFNWSRCMDEGSQPASTGTITEPTENPALRYARCDYDQRVSFRSTTVWNSPKLANQNTFVRTAAGSWTISGLVTADAGQPYSVLDSVDNSYSGESLDIADRVPNQPLWLSNGNLNYAAFAHNAPGTFGNSGRNSLTSPANVDLDPAIYKTFALPKDRVHVLFRFEAFNALNHTNKQNPRNQFNTVASNFGVYATARPPRILQAAVKFTF